MKQLIAITFLLLVSRYAFSADWYCKEVASEWMEKGKSLQTCGIGYGRNENEARADAFKNAQKEFKNVCNKNSRCYNKVTNVDPKRTECKRSNSGYICHRLINFIITDEEKEEELTFKPKEEKEVVHNHYKTINNNYNTINKIKKANIIQTVSPSYKTFVRRVQGVSIYEASWDNRNDQGIHLENPTDSEVESAVRRASSGNMPRIFIHRR